MRTFKRWCKRKHYKLQWNRIIKERKHKSIITNWVSCFHWNPKMVAFWKTSTYSRRVSYLLILWKLAGLNLIQRPSSKHIKLTWWNKQRLNTIQESQIEMILLNNTFIMRWCSILVVWEGLRKNKTSSTWRASSVIFSYK